VSKKKSSRESVKLCFDLGGTKLMAAVINSKGRVLAHRSKSVEQARGFAGLLSDFKFLADSLPAHRYKVVSVASAGPLHSGRGVLLDPTNFFTDQKSWGVVPLVARLKRLFGLPVFLENDAAAAALAESWKGGHGKRSANLLALTLGTGVGVGVIANGSVVRAGRGLHPEASHIPLASEVLVSPCACGAFGCVESYLGGTHFAKRLGTTLGRTVTGAECLQLAQAGDERALEAFREYGRHLALAIRAFAVLFAPEVIVLSGGFSRASEFFLPTALAELPGLMERYREGVDLLPRVEVSKLGDLMGVLGAARVVDLATAPKR